MRFQIIWENKLWDPGLSVGEWESDRVFRGSREDVG
jgi:hypothetical protein